jgi:rare lipoprotein A
VRGVNGLSGAERQQSGAILKSLFAASLALLITGCAHNNAGEDRGFHPPLGNTKADPTPAPPAAATTLSQGTLAPDDTKQTGLATWYGSEFAGKPTANGERFDPNAMTAAHRKLKFGTWVEVRRVDTGRTVRVRINDRGPWGDSRKVIDLSRRAATDLDMIKEGAVKVEVRVVHGPE